MIIAILTTIFINTAIAANPAIIFGSQGYGKNLATSGIEMASGNRIDDNATNMSIDTNLIVNSTGYFTPAIGDDSERPATPTSFMVRGNTDQGCLEYYDGSAWTCVVSAGFPFPVLSKGSIITSDGLTNGEFTACADGEVLIWDSAEATGIRCEAKNLGEELFTTVEVNTGDTYDGDAVYKRCYKTTVDYTSSSSLIVTWDANLIPINALKVTNTNYILQNFTDNGSNFDRVRIDYDSSTGNVLAFPDSRTVYSGTTFCMLYTK